MFSNNCPVCSKKLSYFDGYDICDHCKAYKKKQNLIKRQLYWAKDKVFLLRIPVFVGFIYMFIESLRIPWYSEGRSNIVTAFDLGIHELGHILFIPFGEFMHIAGGCLFQCIFPVMWLVVLFRRKWYFASAMCWCWLGVNLFDVAAYAADARARLLPLSVGFGGISEQGNDEAYDQAHDWYQILSRLHHLNWDLTIGHYFRVAGSITFIIGITIGGVLLSIMLFNNIKNLNLSKNKNIQKKNA